MLIYGNIAKEFTKVSGADIKDIIFMAAVNAIERVERKKNNKQEELIKSVVYKEESDGVTFILTTDKNDIYVEPVEPEPYVPTEEEIADQERQRKIVEISNQIDTLKSQLSDTDYIFVKCYEASLVDESVDEYDFEALHTERQSIRKQINTLEDELKSL